MPLEPLPCVRAFDSGPAAQDVMAVANQIKKWGDAFQENKVGDKVGDEPWKVLPPSHR